jgi:cobalt-zinc-cadmium efflux system membrane fusion protein
MAKVRAVVPNPERMLRAGMYVTAAVQLGDVESALLLDRGSVHQFGGNPFVFLQIAPDLYEVRRIEVGRRQGDQVTVTDGLKRGDHVVVAQSYLVKSEFQKSRLGAGCAE